MFASRASSYARVLRSPHPHAEITRIDTSRAAALPGVYAVISSADAPQIRWYEDSFVFDRTVRFVGDEVAAVAAESEEIADDALRLIEVDYKLLPFVTDLDDAQKPDAPKIRPDGLPHNAAAEPQVYERGDVAAGFAAAEVVVERHVHDPDRPPQRPGAARVHGGLVRDRIDAVDFDPIGLRCAPDRSPNRLVCPNTGCG